jgi:molybdate transport system regulatory protein
MSKPIVRFRVDFDNAHAVGPGKIELLEHIRETGSLSQAGREIGMSYRRAWLLLDSLNTSFKEPVVSTSIGGKAGGGATLTPFGDRLIRAYRELEKEFAALATQKFAAIGDEVKNTKPGAITRTPLVRSPSPRRVKTNVKAKGRARA